MNASASDERSAAKEDEDAGCALCGGRDVARWSADLPRLGQRAPSRFHVARCRDCGALQTRPLPTADETRRAYGAAYTWRAQPNLATALEAAYRRALVRIDQMRTLRCAAHFASGTRLLDVGCGDGLLVSEARRHGLLAFGVDRPDAPLWPACRPEWRIAGEIERVDQPPATWDIVSFFHVAEHLRDPRRALAAAHGWLRRDGVLVVQTPNADCLEARWFGSAWYGWDVPRHVVHFTAASLARTVREAGFTVLRTRHLSWRDNGPMIAGSLLPSFDPLAERERVAGSGTPRPATLTLLRRIVYAAVIWGLAPLNLVEAALGRAPTVTIIARKDRAH